MQTFLKLGSAAADPRRARGRRPARAARCSPIPVRGDLAGQPRPDAAAAVRAGRRSDDDRARSCSGSTSSGPRKYVERRAISTPVFGEVVSVWEEILTDLERDPLLDRRPARLDGQAAAARWATGTGTTSPGTIPKLRLLDLQYHDVDPARGLYDRLVGSRPDAAPVHRRGGAHGRRCAPPERTRAYFRGECVARFGDAIVAANWDSLVFDVGRGCSQAGAYDGATAGTQGAGRGLSSIACDDSGGTDAGPGR